VSKPQAAERCERLSAVLAADPGDHQELGAVDHRMGDVDAWFVEPGPLVGEARGGAAHRKNGAARKARGGRDFE